MPTTANPSSMQVTKLSEHIGAEVTGIDLTQPVDSVTRQRLNRAVVEHVALVIRDQRFTAPQFAAAAALFGELMEQEAEEDRLPGVPCVGVLSSRKLGHDGNIRKVGPKWHTDHTSYLRPPKYTTLYPVELPRSGGGTSVVNMRAAYAALPDAVKRRIDPLITANVIVSSAVTHASTARLALQKELNPEPVLQPLVRTHPDTGAKAIYFSQNRVENIVGMTPQDSQVLLQELLDTAVRPAFVYSHTWRLGDMLIWDNRASMHKANYDYDPTDPSQRRYMYRILVLGERPV